MKLSPLQQGLSDALAEVLKLADDAEMSMVAIKIAEAQDHFWHAIGSGNFNAPEDTKDNVI